MAPVPGMQLAKKPMALPRRIGRIARFQSSLFGQQVRYLVDINGNFRGIFGHLEHLGEGEQAHRYAHETEPVQERGNPIGEPFDSGGGVHPDRPEEDPEGPGEEPLDHRVAHQGDDQGHAQRHQGEILRRAEADGEGGQRGRQEHQAEDAQRPGDEGADRRYPQRRAGPAVLAHLVAVEAGHDGGGLARQVHQDGGRRTAVHGPVVNAGKHDDGGRGVHPEGEGDEHGRPGNGPDAGEDADDRPHRHAEEAVEKVGEGKGRRETVKQVFDHDSSLLYIPRNPVGRGDFSQRWKIA